MDNKQERQAYMMGMKLRSQGHSLDVVFARMEKSGIPENLVKQVIDDLELEESKTAELDKSNLASFGWIRLGIALLLAAISAAVFPGMIIMPIGFILAGIVLLLINRNR